MKAEQDEEIWEHILGPVCSVNGQSHLQNICGGNEQHVTECCNEGENENSFPGPTWLAASL